MRLLLLVLLAGPLAFAATEPLAIVQPVISQMEEGAAAPAGFYYTPGEVLFFTCRVAHYAKTADLKVHIAYSVEAFDPKGVAAERDLSRTNSTTKLPSKTRTGCPRSRRRLTIPPLAGSGNYKVVVKAEDVIAKTTAQIEVPFEVRGHVVRAERQSHRAQLPLLPR